MDKTICKENVCVGKNEGRKYGLNVSFILLTCDRDAASASASAGQQKGRKKK